MTEANLAQTIAGSLTIDEKRNAIAKRTAWNCATEIT